MTAVRFASLQHHRPLLLFLGSALVVYLVARSVASHPSGSEVLEVAATLDLTLFVPVLYYLLMVRGGGWPALTVMPVFLAALALPDGREGTLRLMRHAALPVELFLLVMLARRAKRARARFHCADGGTGWSGCVPRHGSWSAAPGRPT